jgi:hypothetical protein
MVDDPPLEASDTGRMRALLVRETQDDWHDQFEFNKEVEGKLRTLFDWRRNITEREKGYAAKSSITLLLWMVGALTTASSVVAAVLYHSIEKQQDMIIQLLQAQR